MSTPPPRLEQVMQEALGHHRAGRLADAETGYREVLSHQPENPEALHLMGLLAAQSGRPDLAVTLLERAVEVSPASPDAQRNLGSALESVGRLDEALVVCRRAVELDLASAEAHYNLGTVLRRLERLDEAALAFQESLRLKPGDFRAYNNLGLVLAACGRTEEAIEACKRAVACEWKSADARINLGNALQAGGSIEEAVAAYREATRLDPKSAVGYSNLGCALLAAGQADEAMAACREALRLDPNVAEASNNLGNSLREQSRPAEALDCFRKALAIAPDSPEAQSNYLFTLYFDDRFEAREILAEHRAWGSKVAQSIPPRRAPHRNDPALGRKLRIGFVSPDLRNHVVGCSLRHLLRARDRDRLEMVCYANVRAADSVTRELQWSADQWVNIAGLPDVEAAEQIEADQIDILIDLAAHSGGNRLALFARKPAPVQATYLAYPGTTGLETVDYRLSDPQLDPPGAEAGIYSEETIYLPHCYWHYAPALPTPPVSPAPALADGCVTFGCLNNFAKVSAAALELWIRILQAMPNSRFVLLAPLGSCRKRIRTQFAKAGLQPEQLRFTEKLPWRKYLGTWSQIDIALDPFPFGGGITTCDALWMGAPVVSLAGRTAVGRGGRSILSNIGLPELVAETPEAYELIATSLARDLRRLVELRESLRWRLEHSPLCDAQRFAKDFEAACRRMWSRWCEGRVKS